MVALKNENGPRESPVSERLYTEDRTLMIFDAAQNVVLFGHLNEFQMLI